VEKSEKVGRAKLEKAVDFWAHASSVLAEEQVGELLRLEGIEAK